MYQTTPSRSLLVWTACILAMASFGLFAIWWSWGWWTCLVALVLCGFFLAYAQSEADMDPWIAPEPRPEPRQPAPALAPVDPELIRRLDHIRILEVSVLSAALRVTDEIRQIGHANGSLQVLTRAVSRLRKYAHTQEK